MRISFNFLKYPPFELITTPFNKHPSNFATAASFNLSWTPLKVYLLFCGSKNITQTKDKLEFAPSTSVVRKCVTKVLSGHTCTSDTKSPEGWKFLSLFSLVDETWIQHNKFTRIFSQFSSQWLFPVYKLEEMALWKEIWLQQQIILLERWRIIVETLY